MASRDRRSASRKARQTRTGSSTRGPALHKALGQHHLRHPELCRPLIEFLAPTAAVPVLEIGPGGGVLSRMLAAAGARVKAVELDRSWAVQARTALAGESFSVWVGDALDIPWQKLPEQSQVVGNLPYGIATALIERWLDHAPRLGRAGFLVQYEVAARMTAEPGSRSFGAFGALVQARCACRLLGRVRPGSFRPPPRVESAFVGLDPAAAPAATAALSDARWSAFKHTVRAVFRQRRKSVLNSLADGSSRSAARRILDEAGIDPGRRAESLSLAELVAIDRARSGRGREAPATAFGAESMEPKV